MSAASRGLPRSVHGDLLFQVYRAAHRIGFWMRVRLWDWMSAMAAPVQPLSSLLQGSSRDISVMNTGRWWNLGGMAWMKSR